MRTSGVLMPIFSLPSPYGIGTMGKDARKFVDFLVKGGQKYWQILPIWPTSYGDSPYQSFSSFPQENNTRTCSKSNKEHFYDLMIKVNKDLYQ